MDCQVAFVEVLVQFDDGTPDVTVGLSLRPESLEVHHLGLEFDEQLMHALSGGLYRYCEIEGSNIEDVIIVGGYIGDCYEDAIAAFDGILEETFLWLLIGRAYSGYQSYAETQYQLDANAVPLV